VHRFGFTILIYYDARSTKHCLPLECKPTIQRLNYRQNSYMFYNKFLNKHVFTYLFIVFVCFLLCKTRVLFYCILTWNKCEISAVNIRRHRVTICGLYHPTPCSCSYVIYRYAIKKTCTGFESNFVENFIYCLLKLILSSIYYALQSTHQTIWEYFVLFEILKLNSFYFFKRNLTCPHSVRKP
jgi:hypothetical protein